MRLKATLVSGEEVVIEVPEGLSPNQAREDLLNNEGSFAGKWIEVRTEGKLSRHVRYDQIVGVKTYLT